MYYRSVDDMNQVILRNLSRIPADVDLVVGIPRSGLLAANMISLYLNRPLTDLEGLRERRLIGKGKRLMPGHDSDVFTRARRILVVDDCVSQGTEMKRARTLVAEEGFASRATFVTVFCFPEHPRVADLVFQIVPRPMCFQWSFMHTRDLRRYCLDIDGILCADPTKPEDDDGPRYERFIREARPLLVPTIEVGWLVTCRLEKYRALTEEWLTRYGIRYGELIMMDLPSKEARERSGLHAKFKADAYRSTGAILFVESSPGLAARIAEESGLPVMCLTTNRVIGSPTAERYDIARQRILGVIRRLRRAPRKAMSLLLAGCSPGRAPT